MNINDFLVRLDEMLEKPVGTLKGPERLEDLDGWDSVALISFMALSDEHYGRKLSPKEIGRCETVHELFALVTA